MPPGRSARTRIAERVGPSGTAALARAKESPVALRRFGGRCSGTETHGCNEKLEALELVTEQGHHERRAAVPSSRPRLLGANARGVQHGTYSSSRFSSNTVLDAASSTSLPAR